MPCIEITCPNGQKGAIQGSVLQKYKIQGQILNILTELVEVMINQVNFKSCYQGLLNS